MCELAHGLRYGAKAPEFTERDESSGEHGGVCIRRRVRALPRRERALTAQVGVSGVSSCKSLYK